MTPQVYTTIEQLRSALAPISRVAFVPTMGNLHQGHLNLVQKARESSRFVVASVFVNRLQFGPNEDFDQYPRTLEVDLQALASVGCDAVFAPSEGEIYPQAQTFQLKPPDELVNCWEGKFRPGFFTGVATVVHKLFNIVQPQVALFGEKDYQQLRVIQNMVRQMALPIEIVAVPTARSEDGLALSSRNSYLSGSERALAPQLFATLQNVATLVRAQGVALAPQITNQAIHSLTERGWRPDYIAVCRRTDLQVASFDQNELVVLAAARLGKTRLIDNLEF